LIIGQTDHFCANDQKVDIGVQNGNQSHVRPAVANHSFRWAAAGLRVKTGFSASINKTKIEALKIF